MYTPEQAREDTKQARKKQEEDDLLAAKFILSKILDQLPAFAKSGKSSASILLVRKPSDLHNQISRTCTDLFGITLIKDKDKKLEPTRVGSFLLSMLEEIGYECCYGIVYGFNSLIVKWDVE